MTRIKICGVRTEADVDILNRYLPDYVGFVFAESKRQVTSDRAGRLSQGLDSCIKKVGVFVDSDIEEITQVSEKVGLDVIQLHGNEDLKYIGRLKNRLGNGKKIWKAHRLAAIHSHGFEERNREALEKLDIASRLENMQHSGMDKLLVDAFVKNNYGGNGVQFEWRLLEKRQYNNNIILAGGLCPSNVIEAISIVRPYAVDVSSGVELDGIKNEELIRMFIEKVRRSD